MKTPNQVYREHCMGTDSVEEVVMQRDAEWRTIVELTERSVQRQLAENLRLEADLATARAERDAAREETKRAWVAHDKIRTIAAAERARADRAEGDVGRLSDENHARRKDIIRVGIERDTSAAEVARLRKVLLDYFGPAEDCSDCDPGDPCLAHAALAGAPREEGRCCVQDKQLSEAVALLRERQWTDAWEARVRAFLAPLSSQAPVTRGVDDAAK